VSTGTSLGQRIRALRQERGWTLAALAEQSFTSVSYLNDIEHDRAHPSLNRLQSIAEAFGINVRTLLIGVDPFDSLV
jgi:transcriptional regulator with XRE-family HTH domain